MRESQGKSKSVKIVREKSGNLRKKGKVIESQGISQVVQTLKFYHSYQVIPGSDQNASPTSQKTAGSKLDVFLVRMFAAMSSQILGENFGI